MFSRETLKSILMLCVIFMVGLGAIVLQQLRKTGHWKGSVRKVNVECEINSDEILPIEDLMREHGVLNRLLLIYEEIIKRVERKEHFPIAALSKTLNLMRTFIEDYHEKLEETYIFPIFRKHNREEGLVNTLLAQHAAGRRITDELKSLVKQTQPSAEKIVPLMKEFIRMYRPHEAREDTELFPKIHDLISAKEFKELGEKFEDREKELFGEHGFEHVVDRVVALEKELGIYQLSQFTPSVVSQ